MPPEHKVNFPSRTYRRVGLGERTFNYKVYQILPFYCGTWMILQSELAKLYSPNHQSSRIIWLMKHLLQWLISLDNDHSSLKIMLKLSTSDDQSVSKFFQIRIPCLCISKGMTHIVDRILSTPDSRTRTALTAKELTAKYKYKGSKGTCFINKGAEDRYLFIP